MQTLTKAAPVKRILSLASIGVISGMALLSLSINARACEDEQVSVQTKIKGQGMKEVKLDELKSAFNSESDKVRLVSVLSPTCALCISGHGAVKAIFKDLKSEKLKGFLVWLPMLSKDSSHEAAVQSATMKDDRIGLEGWNQGKEIGEAFSKTLKLKNTTWDVYLVYAPGIKWTGDEPSMPTFWMHQLQSEDGADQKQCLNLPRLKREVEKLLSKS